MQWQYICTYMITCVCLFVGSSGDVCICIFTMNMWFSMCFYMCSCLLAYRGIWGEMGLLAYGGIFMNMDGVIEGHVGLQRVSTQSKGVCSFEYTRFPKVLHYEHRFVHITRVSELGVVSLTPIVRQVSSIRKLPSKSWICDPNFL